ncbi:MAG TPA: hypothetical protein VMG30_09625 [Acidobacteriota bacterium]|nr:hypothetical protein [Acidobacteriota bacterium]
MTKSQNSIIGDIQAEGSSRKLEPPLQTDEDIAWEPFDENLWIPYRIRGSWRGGVLG